MHAQVGQFGGIADEIDGLKRDKNVLMVELVRLRQQQAQADHSVRQLQVLFQSLTILGIWLYSGIGVRFRALHEIESHLGSIKVHQTPEPIPAAYMLLLALVVPACAFPTPTDWRLAPQHGCAMTRHDLRDRERWWYIIEVNPKLTSAQLVKMIHEPFSLITHFGKLAVRETNMHELC